LKAAKIIPKIVINFSIPRSHQVENHAHATACFLLGVSVIFNPIDLLHMAWYRIAWQSTPISW